MTDDGGYDIATVGDLITILRKFPENQAVQIRVVDAYNDSISLEDVCVHAESETVVLS